MLIMTGLLFFVSLLSAYNVLQGMAAMLRGCSLLPPQFAEYDERFWTAIRSRDIGLTLATPSLAPSGFRHDHAPVAIDVNGFDFVPYPPKTALPMGRLLEAGYGALFLSPPPQLQHLGTVPNDRTRRYWECLSPAGWVQVRHDFAIWSVILPRDWRLRLTPRASSVRYTLFQIPEQPAIKEPLVTCRPSA